MAKYKSTHQLLNETSQDMFGKTFEEILNESPRFSGKTNKKADLVMREYISRVSAKQNKIKKATALTTSEFWSVKEGWTCRVTKDYFYNGETHLQGVWTSGELAGKKFDLPSIFFNL